MPSADVDTSYKSGLRLRQRHFPARTTTVNRGRITSVNRDYPVHDTARRQQQATLTLFDFTSTGSSFTGSEELGDEWPDERPRKKRRGTDGMSEDAKQATLTQMVFDGDVEGGLQSMDEGLQSVDEGPQSVDEAAAHVPETPARRTDHESKQEPHSSPIAFQEARSSIVSVSATDSTVTNAAFSTPVKTSVKHEIPSSQTPRSALYTNYAVRRRLSLESSPLKDLGHNACAVSALRGTPDMQHDSRLRGLCDTPITFRKPALPGRRRADQPSASRNGPVVRKWNAARSTIIPDSQAEESGEYLNMVESMTEESTRQGLRRAVVATVDDHGPVQQSSSETRPPPARARSTIPDSQSEESAGSLNVEDYEDAFCVPATITPPAPASPQTQMTAYAPSSVAGMSQFPHTLDPAHSAMDRDADRYGETQRLFPGLLLDRGWNSPADESDAELTDLEILDGEEADDEEHVRSLPTRPDLIDLVSDPVVEHDMPFPSTVRSSDHACPLGDVRGGGADGAERAATISSPVFTAPGSPSHIRGSSPQTQIMAGTVSSPLRPIYRISSTADPSSETHLPSDASIWTYTPGAGTKRFKTVDEIMPLSALYSSLPPGPPSSPLPYDEYGHVTSQASPGRRSVWNSSPPIHEVHVHGTRSQGGDYHARQPSGSDSIDFVDLSCAPDDDGDEPDESSRVIEPMVVTHEHDCAEDDTTLVQCIDTLLTNDESVRASQRTVDGTRAPAIEDDTTLGDLGVGTPPQIKDEYGLSSDAVPPPQKVPAGRDYTLPPPPPSSSWRSSGRLRT